MTTDRREMRRAYMEKYRADHQEQIKANARRYYANNHEEIRIKSRSYHAEHREEANAKHRLYCASRKEKDRARYLLRRFGVTMEQWEAMRSSGCWLCGLPFKGERGRVDIHVDHCHATGRIRGLAHHACNTAVGLLGEDADKLTRIAERLRASQVNNAA